jgi:hypothetical protein
MPGTPIFNIFGELVAIAVGSGGIGSPPILVTMNRVFESMTMLNEPDKSGTGAQPSAKLQTAGVEKTRR